MYECITQKTAWPKLYGPYLSASKLLSAWDLALLIFQTLLTDCHVIKSRDSAQSPQTVDGVTYIRCLLYSFTLIHKVLYCIITFMN